MTRENLDENQFFRGNIPIFQKFIRPFLDIITFRIAKDHEKGGVLFLRKEEHRDGGYAMLLAQGAFSALENMYKLNVFQENEYDIEFGLWQTVQAVLGFAKAIGGCPRRMTKKEGAAATTSSTSSSSSLFTVKEIQMDSASEYDALKALQSALMWRVVGLLEQCFHSYVDVVVRRRKRSGSVQSTTKKAAADSVQSTTSKAAADSVHSTTKAAADSVHSTTKAAADSVHSTTKAAADPVHSTTKAAADSVHSTTKAAADSVHSTTKAAADSVHSTTKAAADSVHSTTKAAGSVHTTTTTTNPPIRPIGSLVFEALGDIARNANNSTFLAQTAAAAMERCVTAIFSAQDRSCLDWERTRVLSRANDEIERGDVQGVDDGEGGRPLRLLGVRLFYEAMQRYDSLAERAEETQAADRVVGKRARRGGVLRQLRRGLRLIATYTSNRLRVATLRGFSKYKRRRRVGVGRARREDVVEEELKEEKTDDNEEYEEEGLRFVEESARGEMLSRCIRVIVTFLRRATKEVSTIETSSQQQKRRRVEDKASVLSIVRSVLLTPLEIRVTRLEKGDEAKRESGRGEKDATAGSRAASVHENRGQRISESETIFFGITKHPLRARRLRAATCVVLETLDELSSYYSEDGQNVSSLSFLERLFLWFDCDLAMPDVVSPLIRYVSSIAREKPREEVQQDRYVFTSTVSQLALRPIIRWIRSLRKRPLHGRRIDRRFGGHDSSSGGGGGRLASASAEKDRRSNTNTTAATSTAAEASAPPLRGVLEERRRVKRTLYSVASTENVKLEEIMERLRLESERASHSVIMINSDIHSADQRGEASKHRPPMTEAQFLKNNRYYSDEMNGKKPLPDHFLSDIYRDIQARPLESVAFVRGHTQGVLTLKDGFVLTPESWRDTSYRCAYFATSPLAKEEEAVSRALFLDSLGKFVVFPLLEAFQRNRQRLAKKQVEVASVVSAIEDILSCLEDVLFMCGYYQVDQGKAYDSLFEWIAEETTFLTLESEDMRDKNAFCYVSHSYDEDKKPPPVLLKKNMLRKDRAAKEDEGEEEGVHTDIITDDADCFADVILRESCFRNDRAIWMGTRWFLNRVVRGARQQCRASAGGEISEDNEEEPTTTRTLKTKRGWHVVVRLLCALRKAGVFLTDVSAPTIVHTLFFVKSVSSTPKTSSSSSSASCAEDVYVRHKNNRRGVVSTKRRTPLFEAAYWDERCYYFHDKDDDEEEEEETSSSTKSSSSYKNPLKSSSHHPQKRQHDLLNASELARYGTLVVWRRHRDATIRRSKNPSSSSLEHIRRDSNKSRRRKSDGNVEVDEVDRRKPTIAKIDVEHQQGGGFWFANLFGSTTTTPTTDIRKQQQQKRSEDDDARPEKDSKLSFSDVREEDAATESRTIRLKCREDWIRGRRLARAQTNRLFSPLPPYVLSSPPPSKVGVAEKKKYNNAARMFELLRALLSRDTFPQSWDVPQRVFRVRLACLVCDSILLPGDGVRVKERKSTCCKERGEEEGADVEEKTWTFVSTAFRRILTEEQNDGGPSRLADEMITRLFVWSIRFAYYTSSTRFASATRFCLGLFLDGYLDDDSRSTGRGGATLSDALVRHALKFVQSVLLLLTGESDSRSTERSRSGSSSSSSFVLSSNTTTKEYFPWDVVFSFFGACARFGSHSRVPALILLQQMVLGSEEEEEEEEKEVGVNEKDAEVEAGEVNEKDADAVKAKEEVGVNEEDAEEKENAHKASNALLGDSTNKKRSTETTARTKGKRPILLCASLLARYGTDFVKASRAFLVERGERTKNGRKTTTSESRVTVLRLYLCIHEHLTTDETNVHRSDTTSDVVPPLVLSKMKEDLGKVWIRIFRVTLSTAISDNDAVVRAQAMHVIRRMMLMQHTPKSIQKPSPSLFRLGDAHWSRVFNILCHTLEDQLNALRGFRLDDEGNDDDERRDKSYDAIRGRRRPRSPADIEHVVRFLRTMLGLYASTLLRHRRRLIAGISSIEGGREEDATGGSSTEEETTKVSNTMSLHRERRLWTTTLRIFERCAGSGSETLRTYALESLRNVLLVLFDDSKFVPRAEDFWEFTWMTLARFVPKSMSRAAFAKLRVRELARANSREGDVPLPTAEVIGVVCDDPG
eukprot:g2925.t1